MNLFLIMGAFAALSLFVYSRPKGEGSNTRLLTNNERRAIYEAKFARGPDFQDRYVRGLRIQHKLRTSQQVKELLIIKKMKQIQAGAFPSSIAATPCNKLPGVDNWFTGHPVLKSLNSHIG